MANNSNMRPVFVSPGVYFSEEDLKVAAKSLGITALGLVGETPMGPAFQVMRTADFAEYQNLFGGTNPEKFRGSQYPKYELPYIAKEFLKESTNLQVCRVLGLSGVNAGDAWVFAVPVNTSNYKGSNKKPLAICTLRSRGEHRKGVLVAKKDPEKGICSNQYEYDNILYYAKKVEIVPSKTLNLNDNCNPSYKADEEKFTIDVNNLGRFTLKVTLYDDKVVNYSVSLNSGEKDYIINILGTNPEVGEAAIYVEELHDVAYRRLVEAGMIADAFTKDNLYYIPRTVVIPEHAPVKDFLTDDESTLKRRNIGERYLCDENSLGDDGAAIKVHKTTDGGKTWTEADSVIGHIYTVVQYTQADSSIVYYYGEYDDGETISYKAAEHTAPTGDNLGDEVIFKNCVQVLSDNNYYMVSSDSKKLLPITCDWNNYKEEYRCASTPWFVSELKGSAEHIELTRLFRFHTVSDGNSANTMFKVSIENIDPTTKTFDVSLRNFYDTDNAPQVIEKFRGVGLVPGKSNYIGLVIGTTNGDYASQSNYITVEVNETDVTKVSVPAGFLGYPVRNPEGNMVIPNNKFQKPYMAYNTNVDEDIRSTRQYFGLSDIVGIDEDVFSYKGIEAYNGDPAGLTPSFHLDARILNVGEKGDLEQTVTIDGIVYPDWITVGKANVTAFGVEPRIGDESTMYETIYDDKRFRKFTAAFCGGWDGWDYYRKSRSNGDEFRALNYRGNIDPTSGVGKIFSVIDRPEDYSLEKDSRAINSDYYAYLSAIRQFYNPKAIDINVLATPGIDYVNQLKLVEDVINMVEVERADCIYVVTTPDKEYGKSDHKSDMFKADEISDNLDDSNITSSYVCSYYPWIKYFDAPNNQYLFLPPTKDFVRNLAYTDNVKYPWYPAAGWNRGTINGEGPKAVLDATDTDILYNNRMNYIESFAKDGCRLWGDLNMQNYDSPMNRVSKRRMLIRVRKLLSIGAVKLTFDPNNPSLAKTYEDMMKGVLNDLKRKEAFDDYKLKVDRSEEARMRMEIPAKIWLKPTPNAEYFPIAFVITPYGASFDDV